MVAISHWAVSQSLWTHKYSTLYQNTRDKKFNETIYIPN